MGYDSRRYASRFLAQAIDFYYTYRRPPSRTTHKQICQTMRLSTKVASISEVPHSVTALIKWSELNHLNINTKKANEMLMGPNDKETRTLMIASEAIEPVLTYKLLGVMTESKLK